jgi:uncharacterized SAM-binding protein YcdF (DUF218 family)
MLLELGVPTNAIGIETASRNTLQNARQAAGALLPAGIRRILLVTSAWHMRRAEREFQRAGFEVIPAPTDHRSFPSEGLGVRQWLPDPEALQLTHVVVKEWLGWQAGAVRR